MDFLTQHIQKTRRRFLTSSASGAGAVALAALLKHEGRLAAESSLNSVAHRSPASANVALRRASEGVHLHFFGWRN